MGTRCTITWDAPDRVRISGVIDERAEVTSLFANGTPETLAVDLSNVTYINSAGVRNWLLAIHQPPTILYYTAAPTPVVELFAIVKGFLGPKGKVVSFAAPYLCDSCGFEKQILLGVGTDVEAGQEFYDEAPEKPCINCGQTMTLDRDVATYFAFLSQFTT